MQQERGGKPDGCATLVNRTTCTLHARHAIYYQDGSPGHPNSGHVALILIIAVGERRVGIANTHLSWDAPSTPIEEQRGYRQSLQLLEQRRILDPSCLTWILCGDLNATADSAVLRALCKEHLDDAYRDRARQYTCVANRRARRIDYLLHSLDCVAHPVDVPSITDATLLPSEQEPSDHLPIMARFVWKDLPGQPSAA